MTDNTYHHVGTPHSATHSIGYVNESVLPVHDKAKKPQKVSYAQSCINAIRQQLPILLIGVYFVYWVMAYMNDPEGCYFLHFIGVCCFHYVLYCFMQFAFPTFLPSVASRSSSLHCRISGHRYYRLALLSIGVAAALVVLIRLSWGDFSRLNPLRGYFVFLFLMYLASYNRTKISWNGVLRALGLQFFLAIFVLRTQMGLKVFSFLGEQVNCLLHFSEAGIGMVYGKLILENHIFAFTVLPVIIFLASIISIIYYLGIFSTFILTLGKGLAWVLECSLVEAIAAACNLILSYSEVNVLLKMFLSKLTKSEIHTMMTVGMASTSGSTLAAYASLGVPANHLVASTVMSIPCGLAISKIVYPETEKILAKDIKLEKTKETNIIEAAANGAQLGTQIVIIIIGMLIAAVSLIAMFDSWLIYFGSRIGIEKLSFEFVCSYMFYPIAYLMGVQTSDCLKVASLIGTKITVNEFVAFTNMVQMLKDNQIHMRSFYLSTYALCGFANLSSIGIQLGALSPLAPERMADFSKLVFSAMICGVVATLVTSCLAALLMDI